MRPPLYICATHAHLRARRGKNAPAAKGKDLLLLIADEECHSLDKAVDLVAALEAHTEHIARHIGEAVRAAARRAQLVHTDVEAVRAREVECAVHTPRLKPHKVKRTAELAAVEGHLRVAHAAHAVAFAAEDEARHVPYSMHLRLAQRLLRSPLRCAGENYRIHQLRVGQEKHELTKGAANVYAEKTAYIEHVRYELAPTIAQEAN